MGQLRYEILGPPAVWVDGVETPVVASRDRVVMCILLLRANQVVTTEQIIDALWADEPPPSARGQIHGCVFRLRRLMADDALRTSPGGYSLRVADAELDVLVFRRALAQGRAALAEGAAATARQLLRHALSLWRGTALATVDSAALRPDAAGLDELYLTAREECIDAELRLGDGDVVGELTELTVRYPLRERFHEQLMLALYAAGRQSDALDAYRNAQAILAEQLGVEPGHSLQDLHRRILRREPSLAGRRADRPAVPIAAVQPPLAIPAQLPLDVCGFTGRRVQLAELDAALASAHTQPTAMPVCVITGTAGVGKTTLAVHWAHGVRAEFPDGQLYADLRGFGPEDAALSPEEVIRGFFDALSIPPERVPADPASQTTLYRSLLAGRRVLVVLDNARDVAQVRPLLPGSPGCMVVVSSRNQLTGLLATEGARPVILDLLSGPEASELLVRRIGPVRASTDPEAVGHIIFACARLPLALSIAAARAVARPGFPLSALAAELRDSGRLDAFDGADATPDVRTMLWWSYRSLDDELARLFRLLGLHPGPHFTPEAAASLGGTPAAAARRMLAELARAHMIAEPAPEIFWFHDLLRAYASELTHATDPASQRRAAVHRMLDHYLHTASAADLLLDPHRVPVDIGPPQPGVTVSAVSGTAQALAWFLAEHQVLVTAVKLAASQGFEQHAWQLAWAHADFLYSRGRWHDLATINEAALVAAQRVGSETGQAHARRGLAGAETSLGRPACAYQHLRQALALFAGLHDQASQAHIHRNLAQVLTQQGRYRKALGQARQAYGLCRALDDLTGQARALGAIGGISSLVGNHQRALISSQRALALHRQTKDRRGEADTLYNLGLAHHHLGDYESAAQCFRSALALFSAGGERSSLIVALVHLGDTLRVSGDVAGAQHAWRQALGLIDELDDPNTEKLLTRLHLPGASAGG